MPIAKFLHLTIIVRRAALLAGIVLLAGLGLSFWLYQHSLHLAQSATASRFEYRTDRIRAELGYRFTILESSLQSVAGLIGSGEGFDRLHWRRYFETLRIAEAYEGRLLVAFAPRVRAAERGAHERQARAEGVPDYVIRSSATQSEYFPLAYMHRIAAAPGFVVGADLRDDPAARDAMVRRLYLGEGLGEGLDQGSGHA